MLLIGPQCHDPAIAVSIVVYLREQQQTERYKHKVGLSL